MPTLLIISSNETHFYPFTVSVNKCAVSCNVIDDPYARVCVPDKVIRMYVIERKNWIVAYVGVDVKNWMIEVLVKMILCEILVRVVMSVINHLKSMNI